LGRDTFLRVHIAADDDAEVVGLQGRLVKLHHRGGVTGSVGGDQRHQAEIPGALHVPVAHHAVVDDAAVQCHYPGNRKQQDSQQQKVKHAHGHSMPESRRDTKAHPNGAVKESPANAGLPVSGFDIHSVWIKLSGFC